MKSASWRRTCVLVIMAGSLVAALLLPLAAVAQAPDVPVAKAVSVQGTVEAQRVGQTPWQTVRLNDTFRPGDTIRVQARSRADIALLDQSVLRLNANTTIKVEAPKEGKTGVIDMIRGAAHFFSRGPNSLEVNTPFTVAGVRGTEFLIQIEPQATLLTVFEGTVVAQNAAGSLTLNNGQSATAEAGKAPTVRVVARPRDAVQWTLYYPPVIQDRLAPTYRAQSLLAVGAVDEARDELRRVLQSSPGNADALSLQSIMTLVQGDKEQALQLAQSAVAAQPNSASALIARSYAEQARFDLQAARASVQRGVEVEPANALAWARLAELDSSFGDLDKSAAAAQRAVELQPELSRTQTVLGFAHLTSIRVQQARASFEKAIALDQADPLPRLGLGLTKIRDGELDAGSREIEVAASLDPGNALVRSYLGKAYYEEKRSPRDEREFGVARQLDPLDPTPWFYDAIAKQTTNRPLEALQALEKARELNDNRAVYRSQLLLDSDAAARAAGQARIYSELGFQQRALVEGWLAVNRDPTNFSAHRFLADSYSVLPRHEIARVSELLQSQLLAPVTNSPLQPRLGESNLMLISSGGPGVASFNEFNPLFNRDGISLVANAMGGQLGTAAGDLVVAGISGRAGYSIGYSKFRTDGFRVNADQDDSIGNAFVQFDLTPQTSLQAEYRRRRTDWGDLQQRFFAGTFSTTLRNTVDSDTYRLGLRHTFTPSSTLIASFIRQQRDTTARFSQAPDFDLFIPGLDGAVGIPERASGLEVQHVFRSDRFNLRSGLGYVDVDRTENVDVTLLFPLPFPPGAVFPVPQPTATTNARSRHVNVYAYGTLQMTANAQLVLGASHDTIDASQASEAKHQFNPKLGLIWNVLPATTVRAAAFRVLKRTLVTNQTLEPTEVAGFNQFYDDANFTESRRYGVAVDQKFSATAFGGLEASKRATIVPWTCANPVCGALGDRKADWDERQVRAYAFWSPHPSWALRSEYLFEQFKRDPAFTGGGARDLDSQRLQLGVRYFQSAGLSASVTTTYWRQKGEFGDNNMFQPGSENFWTTDAAISYRLPQRMGFLSVGATNLFNKQFRYLDTDAASPTIQPRRMVFARVTFVLP
ncbi:MAG: FecR domain-containing protein [Burkholderiaceae bacterium]